MVRKVLLGLSLIGSLFCLVGLAQVESCNSYSTHTEYCSDNEQGCTGSLPGVIDFYNGDGDQTQQFQTLSCSQQGGYCNTKTNPACPTCVSYPNTPVAYASLSDCSGGGDGGGGDGGGGGGGCDDLRGVRIHPDDLCFDCCDDDCCDDVLRQSKNGSTLADGIKRGSGPKVVNAAHHRTNTLISARSEKYARENAEFQEWIERVLARIRAAQRRSAAMKSPDYFMADRLTGN